MGRRKIGIDDSAAWVFNRMADVYDARPPYPLTLIERLFRLAGGPGSRVVDLGAGIGHLSLPLAERGCTVFAVEPAQTMLERLRSRAPTSEFAVQCLHAAAEAVPLPPCSVQLALIADAMHFLDAALTGHEVRRLLQPGGALAIVTCEPGNTPFMRDVVRLMELAAPRRPRATRDMITQLAGVAGITLHESVQLEDHTPVNHAQLERILRSISFIGPAMHAQRFSQFWRHVRALSDEPVWSRRCTLRSGRSAS